MRMSAWDDKVAQGVQRRATVGRISALANVLTHGLEKIMQISVLGLGAMDVFDGTLSIGALVAFNMIAGRVTGPLVQIVGLINEYQETALAVKMLGTVMQHPPERDPSHVGISPEITGNIEFIMLNSTDPVAEVDGERASLKTKHPLFADPAVRQALNLLIDRVRIRQGKPQLYGTQFKKDKDGPWYLWQVDPAVTDEERAKWDVPPLSRAKARVEALNGGTFQPH